MSLKRLQPINTNDPQWHTIFKAILERLITVNGDIRIILFGSFITGRFTAESDLDVAVVIPDEITDKQFLTEVFRQGAIVNWPLDLVVLPRSRFEKMKDIGGLCFDVHAQGVELYPDWKLK